MPHARKAHWPNCLKRELQAKEYVTLQKEAKEIIVRKFRSPLFLAIAILMTAIAAISVLTMLLSFTSKSGNMVVDLIASLPMILCSLASAIAFWKMYGRKTEFTENKMNGTNAYMRLMEVVGILSCILFYLLYRIEYIITYNNYRRFYGTYLCCRCRMREKRIGQIA